MEPDSLTTTISLLYMLITPFCRPLRKAVSRALMSSAVFIP
jgi:hypothetical protein